MDDRLNKWNRIHCDGLKGLYRRQCKSFYSIESIHCIQFNDNHNHNKRP